MKIFFPSEIKEYENKTEAVNRMIEDINAGIASTDKLVFSHLNIDGIDVYENHYQYLLKELSEINEIKIIMKTKQEVTIELQQSLNEYLERALPVMSKLSDQFYQGESNKVWESFVEFTDGLQWINSAVETLSLHSKENAQSYYKNVSAKIESALIELVEALEIKDTITIADMIQYEIIETLTDLKQSVHH
ncbi:hypothetical protein [Jeotgalibacillus soli]|uniref:DUF8042 domain-containing protein n=1 Tax=Jeotgalibacillus soli TaxID=889306 RepID=A0A0C2S7C2_9BACL|nr:hypothetical protein [Jeotgalibacillus soli]KIL49919.1 hypothetical protein KP78_13870 [Jeotgalibacillus soli]